MANPALNAVELRTKTHRAEAKQAVAAEKHGKRSVERDFIATERGRRQAEADLEAQRTRAILLSGRLF